jgi:hypothetical protein
MKQIIFIAILFFTVGNASAQNGDPIKFKGLMAISREKTVTDSEFKIALRLVKNLDFNTCPDYIKKKNGEEYVAAGLTSLFGEICLKNNSHNAVNEYINYMKRNSGSAEEAISFCFEKLFVQQPEYTLSLIGYNKGLLNELEWGFVSNETDLTSKNCKKRFYQINPGLKAVYPKYKKAIDYLLSEISGELKNWESNKKSK